MPQYALADRADITDIFGDEDWQKTCSAWVKLVSKATPSAWILKKFVKRSSGIFLALTGSGKSFLTRMILAGLIHDNTSSTLIFDMHNEYGPDSTSSDTGQPVFGLKGKFSQPCAWLVLVRALPLVRWQRILIWKSLIPKSHLKMFSYSPRL